MNEIGKLGTREVGTHKDCGGTVLYTSTPSAGIAHCQKCKMSSHRSSTSPDGKRIPPAAPIVETPKPKPELFLLKERIPNAGHFDQRCRSDWRKAEFIEPGEYLVEDFTIRPTRGNCYFQDRLSSNDERFEVVLMKLEPAPKTPTRVLRLKDENLVREAKDVLEKLFDAGRFTIEDVEKAADRVLEDWESEED